MSEDKTSKFLYKKKIKIDQHNRTFASICICPNREQSCGKPEECEWKLLLRGAESTHRCISVAFSDADKRCLENCRNFLESAERRGRKKEKEGEKFLS